jgi:L-aspartate semialdehyde sulfurtransferase ferredoxin
MITKRILLVFPKTEADKPLVNDLIRYYNLTINIIRARISHEEEGHLLIDILGSQKDIQKGLKFIRSLDITINETNKGLQWDRSSCVQCSNCVTHCPTDALYIKDRKTMEIDFNEDLCIECLSCIKNCPYGSCSSLFLTNQ